MTYWEDEQTQVRAAIRAVLTSGQSYTIGDRTYTRADLNSLRSYLKYVDSEVAREAAGGIVVKGITPIHGN